jgi:prolyl oligopeptidase
MYSARLSTLGQDRIAWSCESFTEPTTWWVAADGEAPRPTALRTTTPVDLSGYQVTREFATSRDGTRVPLNVITAPGTPRDGTAPALLTAYGGYGISLVPRFDPELLLWLESTGHLAGSLDQSIDETTDRHAFLFDQLGLGYRHAAPA